MKNSNLKCLLLGVFCFLSMVYFPMELNAQNEYEKLNDIEKKIFAYSGFMMKRGYDLHFTINRRSLPEDGETDFTMELEKGYEYLMYAVGDGNCEDIDLCLYDQYDNEIECEYEEENSALVGVVPNRPGNFRLNVWMADCKENKCGYAVAVYKK